MDTNVNVNANTNLIRFTFLTSISCIVLCCPIHAFVSSAARTAHKHSLPDAAFLLMGRKKQVLISSPGWFRFASSMDNFDEQVEVIVLGAGLGGLSCAALASKYGLETLCLEAHDTPGGCAHSFQRFSTASNNNSNSNNNKNNANNPTDKSKNNRFWRKQEKDNININSNNSNTKVPFCFDSGPSLITGLSNKGTNPLRQVLDAVGMSEEIEWCTYNGWMVHDTSDGISFRVTTGNGGEFEQALEQKAGWESKEAFREFKEKILASKGLAEASTYVPPFALRGGVATTWSLSRYMLRLLSIGTKGTLLTGPFTKCLDLYEMKNPFVKKWFDYLAFALSGEDAAHTQAAPIAYMMRDLHSEGAVLDYPMGGMESLIQALVKGIRKHGGELRLNSRVESFVLEENQLGKATCTGVVLEDGTRIQATKGVVCNAPLWNMARILQDSVPDDAPKSITNAVSKVQKQADAMHMTGSFMHLHLGIPKAGLPDDLECHHSVLNMDLDVRAEQNMVIISIPTVFDPSLAPEGYHIVHAYTAASDSFDDWLPFISAESGKVGARPSSGAAAGYGRSDAYQKLKEEKCEALWKAVECVIPDVRQRAKERGSIVLIGTPLTHRRYNQRFRGTYGPGPAPGKEIWELGGALTPISNLLACGDTTFPGIGLPGVAASGTIAANTLVSVQTQMNLMTELQKEGSLQ